jgi:DNA-binding XRE family transcriptional regulator
MSYVAHHSYVYGQGLNRPMPLPPRVITERPTDFLPRDVSSRFGLRLRELRREHNLTQLRMAIDFGIDRSFISDVERGRKSISLPMLEIMALGLHMSLSELLRGI